MPCEVWSLLETKNNGLHETALKMASEAKRAARIFSGLACGFLLGKDLEEYLDILKPYGLDKLYLCSISQEPTAEDFACFLKAAAKKLNPEVVLLAATPTGKEAASRLAVGLKAGLISECTDFEKSGDQYLARKPVYDASADALMTWADPPYLASLKLDALEDIKSQSATAPLVEWLEFKPQSKDLEFVKSWRVDLKELEINEAGIVFGVGKGVDEKVMAQINRLAKLCQAVVGGTRIAVHNGLIPVSRQIGTTGKWLNSDLYLALGISGAPQHVMGIKSVENILAINISPDAPIFKYAKLGVVGDVKEIVPKIVNLLNNRRNGQ